MALNEGKHRGEFILSEADEMYSRDQVTIAAAAGAMAAGTLLGKVTATGKFVAYSNTANDGSEVAAGIAYDNIPDLAVDQKAVAITRHCEVIASELTGLDSAGRADLLALGIVCR